MQQRIQLHSEVLRLREDRLSYGGIIERIYRSNGVRLSKSNISGWVNGKHRPLGKVNKFNARPSQELAYVIGVKFSDGDLYHKPKNHQFTIELKVIDYEFAAETGRRLASLLGRKRPYQPRWARSQFRWRVTASSVLLYRFLDQPLDKLSPYIERCRNCVAAFLRALFDGEGSITHRSLTVHNTEKDLLLYIQDLLQRYFRIETTGPHEGTHAGYRFRSRNGKIYETKKQCYFLYVRVESLKRFNRYIGFTIRRKQRRLTEAIQR